MCKQSDDSVCEVTERFTFKPKRIVKKNGIVLAEKLSNSEVKILKSVYLDRLYGVFLIALSAVSFGAMAIFARIAYDAGSDPITVLFLRFSIAGIFMLAIMVAKSMVCPRGRTLITLVFMGAVGYVGLSFAFFTALTMAPAGLVAILLYLYPAFVTLLATIFLKKPVTLLKFVALSLTFGEPYSLLDWTVEAGRTSALFWRLRPQFFIQSTSSWEARSSPKPVLFLPRPS